MIVFLRLEELIDRSHSESHLGLITVGFAFKDALSLSWDIIDDQVSLSTILALLDLVKPVRIAFEDFNSIKEPINSCFLNINLAVNLDSSVFNVSEAL